MYRTVWNKCYQSVACINLIDESGIEIGYFSGFKVARFLITDAEIKNMNRAQLAIIKFVGNDGCTIEASHKIPYAELMNRLINEHDRSVHQFSVINIDFEVFEKIGSLKLNTGEKPAIGMSLALFGYQFDQPNLTIKSGILSSVLNYPQNREYLQFDGFVKKGNAGGPLIDPETGNVLGLIGYKLTKAIKTYKKIINIINANIEVLKEAEGEFNISEVDPMQVLVVNQNQIKQLAGEIYKSASMGMGYALSSSCIMDFFVRNRIDINPQKDALFNAR